MVGFSDLLSRIGFKGLNVLLQSAGGIIMKQVVINIHKNIETTPFKVILARGLGVNSFPLVYPPPTS